ncbi:hypothetical protein [Mycobacterium sp.]|uniref:hypothetical protein n=1 Tax=Mycobacterium sp. TaxID=1785 RepID=UPI0028B54851|nr:TetR/AcrR family transcriptional regulator [Mycobacterium sp.]MDT5055894.1 hypothetical protein [Mycobacterium sp.]
MVSQVDEYHDSAAKQRVNQPVREVLARGIRDRVFRDDIPGDALFEMFSALIERALWLTVAEAVTPEQAADVVLTVFLDGARTD